MTTHRIWISAALLTLVQVLAQGVAQAQRVVAAPPISAVHARPAPARLTLGARVSGKSATRSRSAGTLAAGNGFGLFNQFPGLGAFNFGANPDWIMAAIDPATQWRLFEARRFLGNVGVAGPGFYLLDSGAYYLPAESAEAEGAPQEQGAPAEAQTPQAMRAEPQFAPADSAALEDVGEFVLVLRSGSRVEAVAFTRADDHIVYVTADGFRRTLALTDLDHDATIRVNEERGTPLAIPL